MIRLDESRVHFNWSAHYKPIITIEPGATVVVDTREGSDGQMAASVTAQMMEESLSEILDPGRIAPLTGPIAINGALPGDTLKIEILDLVPRGTAAVYVFPAWQRADFIAPEFRDTFPEAYIKQFDMDVAVAQGYVDLNEKVRIALSPMLGMIGTAPAKGTFAVNAPREFGGNMDARVVRKGSILYLPVFVPGANLSLGDGHAVQGDGEICATGLECAMRATLRVSLEKVFSFTSPFVETEESYMAMGYGRDLDEAP